MICCELWFCCRGAGQGWGVARETGGDRQTGWNPGVNEAGSIWEADKEKVGVQLPVHVSWN